MHTKCNLSSYLNLIKSTISRFKYEYYLRVTPLETQPMSGLDFRILEFFFQIRVEHHKIRGKNKFHQKMFSSS
jgi:hypothetical protein